MVSRFAHELRLNLWMEHLGLDTYTAAQLIRDPIHMLAYHSTWRAIAKQNTAIYRAVFPEDVKAIPLTPEAHSQLLQVRYVLSVL